MVAEPHTSLFPIFLAGLYLPEQKLEEFGRKKTVSVVALGVLIIGCLYGATYCLLSAYPDQYGVWISMLYGNAPFQAIGISAGCGVLGRLAQYIAALFFGGALFCAVPGRILSRRCSEGLK